MISFIICYQQVRQKSARDHAKRHYSWTHKGCLHHVCADQDTPSSSRQVSCEFLPHIMLHLSTLLVELSRVKLESLIKWGGLTSCVAWNYLDFGSRGPSYARTNTLHTTSERIYQHLSMLLWTPSRSANFESIDRQIV
jgi:hypothetical protein